MFGGGRSLALKAKATHGERVRANAMQWFDAIDRH
jgi:hypothetical protein